MEAYSGWGGAQKAFSEKAEGEWGEIRDRLKELLSDDEFASQRHTVLTAFYTPAPVIGAIYDALREAGIGQGDTPAAILEPGCGTGNFMRLAPADLALDFHGVELDPISARIAQALCPEAHITAAGLEECRVSPASFDAAIGNVPYSGDIKIDGMPIHDYFIKKSVEAVRPGGVVAVLTSRYTLDKNSTATRRALAEQAELLGAVRLPAETFKRQAGTEALSDILLLRRRPEPIALADDELPEWVETSPFEDTVNINRYFNEHPGRAVGDMSIVSGPMGPTLGVSFEGGGAALGDRVSDLLRDSVDRAGVVEMAAAEEAAGVSAVPTAPTKFEFSVAADGTIWYGTEDAVEPFTPGGGKTGPERARAMLSLRDGARALLALERDPGADDDEVEEAIAGLSAEYDSFLERYGRINSKKNLAVFPSKGFTDHSLALNLLSLEKVDSNGEVTGKADILKKRLVTPEAPTPEHVGNPSDALAVTIDARGEVDMDFLADLMETDVQTALERLGDLVVTDPDDAAHVMTADEYLSGDVGGKLEHVRALLDAERGRAERQTREAWNGHLGFSVDADGLPGDVSDALAQLRKTHLWESSLNPTTSRFAVDGFAHSEGLDRGARRISWDCWPALIPLALEAYDGPRPIAVQDGDDRASVSTGNPLIDLLARGLGDFYSGQINKDVAKTPAHAIKYLVCDSGLSDEELGSFFAAGGSGILNRSEYFETFRAVAGVEIEPPVRSSYGEVSVREARIENGMRLARALRAAPDAVEYLYRIERKQRSEDRVTKADLLRRDGRPSYLVDYYSGEPAKLSDLATEEGLERFREHKARFMEAAKLAVPPADPDRIAALERLESRLETVQPVKLVPGQIACQLGSSWVPASVIRDFALETFKIGYGHESRVRGSYQTAAQARGLEVRYSEVSGRWSVTSASGGMDESVAKKWGVGSYNCFMILTAALNGGLIQIEKDNPDYNPVAEKSKKKIPDPVATAAANAKRRELEEAFREWVWKDEDRVAMLADIYNRKLNRVAPRAYSGDYLSLPGMSPDIQLRKHQRDAVARIIQDGEGTLIAHTVGAGKTFTGIAAMHELKRLGRARKPMIVVPNNLTEQWAADYLKLYPDAKLLVLTDAAAKNPDSVRRFWGQAASGDWDAVIVGFSRFEKLQMSYGAQKAALTARIDELEESRLMELEDGAGEKDFSVKQIEGVRDRFKSKLQSLEKRNASKTLEGATFEEVGCDAIFVDEAHYFKNLAVSGGSVPGMQTSDAAKCEDLLMKCEYLRGSGRGSNIVFATGTPVTNTMAELYNMQRYLSPNLLASQGVSNFSAWAKTFGEVTETLEPKPEGGGLDIKRRFARFQNLPELMSSFHCYSDIMTADDLDLDLPELESHAVAVPATPEQLAEVEALVKRGEKVHAGCDPSVDNMLKITGDGRKVALDPKLLYLEDDPDMEPLSGGKVDACVRNILDIRGRTEAERGAQLVFVDSSTPASGRWNIQDDVRRRLIEAGVPESEIACVTDAKGKSKQKEALYEKVRSGDIRILLGSTTTLGTGTNVQTRLAAIHDLDCPWRPSDLEQRLGRIVRQGNGFDHVHDFRYVSTGTFDSYLYSIVERKQRFISQVFTNKSPVRTMDDLDETVLSLAQMKQIAEGDPTVAERMDVENKIGQLKLMRESHLEGLADVQHKIETQYRPLVDALAAERDMLADDQIPFSEADLVRQQTLGSKDSFLTVGGVHIADKEEAIRALRRAAYDVRPGREETIGTYRGLSVVCRRQHVLDDDWLPYIGLAVDPAKHVHMSERVFPSGEKGAFTVLTQMDRIIAKDAKGPAEIELKLGTAHRALADAQKAAKEPFPKQAELDELEQRLAVLEQERIEGYTLNRAEGGGIDREIGRLTGHAACIAVDVPTWCRIAGDPLDAVADALADLLDETPSRFELEQLAAASPLLKANTPGIPVFPEGIAPAANSYTLAGCCRAALVRGLSSPELYATALMAAETAISTARRFGGEVPEAVGTSEGLFSATIGIGGTDTAEIGVNCVDARSDGGILIEGAAYPIADGGRERAFFGFVDTAEDSRDYMREVPDGADGIKRLADAALAASCATLSPNTADPCLVARLAAESRERSRSITDPCTQARGAKRAAGSRTKGGAAGRGPAL